MDDRQNLEASVRAPKQSLLKNYSVIFASIIIILGGIHAARGILGPIFMAVFFTVLLISPINWLRKRGVSMAISLTAVIIAVAVVGLCAATVIGSQLSLFVKNIPEYRDQFNDTLSSYNLRIDDFIPFLRESKREQPLDEPDEVEVQATSTKKALHQRRSRRNLDEQTQTFDERTDLPQSSDASSPNTLTAPEHGNAPEPLESAPTGSDSNNTNPAEGANAVAAEPLENVRHETGGASQTSYLQSTSAPTTLSSVNPSRAEQRDTRILADSSSAYAAELNEWNSTEVARVANDASRSAVVVSDDSASGLGLRAPPTTLEEAEREAQRDNADLTGSDTEDDYDDYDNIAPEFNAMNMSSHELFRFVRGLAGELKYLASNAVIVTLLVIFMLCETQMIPVKLVAVLGRRRFTNSHIENVLDDIRNYMMIKTLISFCVGVSVTILLVVSKVEYPLLWGFVAFLLNYIPNIGSVVAAIPPLILAMVQHGVFVGCIDAVFFALINCAFGYWLEPRLLGNGLNLSPLIVLISLILFGWLLGPVGMFLSPPLAVIMKIIFQSFPETRWIAALMANRVMKEPEDAVAEN
ncbi:MAG: AI-2E family transporter [Planctomycetia bacterium]|nr:AI-2E family transporter [Planctomycetia bacterium]